MKKIIIQCSWVVFDFRHISGNSAPEHSFQALLQGTYAAFQTDRDAADVGRWHPGEEAAAVKSSGTGRERLYPGSSGVKHLRALNFSVFWLLVGVSGFNGEPPAEAVRRQQIASFKHNWLQQLNNWIFIFILFLIHFSAICPHASKRLLQEAFPVLPSTLQLSPEAELVLLPRTAVTNKTIYIFMVCPFAGQTLIAVRTANRIKTKQSSMPSPSPPHTHKKQTNKQFATGI